MADDYLVRSGAKELLTNAVASLLEVHPVNPVAFLAHHFDSSGSRVVRCVRMLQACPAQRKAFSGTVYRAFRLLSCGADGSSPILDAMASVGPTAPARVDYDQVIAALCADFPMHLRDRVVDTVRSPAAPSSTSEVSLKEFQRGVEICVLLEELFDVVEELFTSIDRGRIGEVKLAVLLSALENATQQSKQRDTDEQALHFLKTCFHSRRSIPDISSGDTLPLLAPSAVDDPSRFMRLSELQEVVFHAVFTP